jgi:hypothetical protein
VTGPATGEPDRRSTAPMRTSGTWNAASAILILLALGFALRLIIAYLLPGSGFANDVASFRGWANDLFTNGLYGFYQRPGFHDYTPGYLYYLWVLGGLAHVFPTLDLVKIPAILSDLAIGWLIWSMILELGGGRRAAILGAALYLFVPITWFDSVVWGQVDSVGIVFLLLSVRALWRDRPELASVFAVVAAIVKPQLGIIIFVAGAVLLRRYLVDPLIEPAGAGRAADDAAPAGEAPVAAAQARPEAQPRPEALPRPAWAGSRGPLRLATSALAGLATAVGLSWPFGLDLAGLIDQVFKTAGGYPYVTVNAYNPWALVERAGVGLAASGQWLCDAVTGTGANAPCPPGSQLQVAGLPALVVGGLLMAVVLAVILVFVMWRPDRLTILVGLAVLALALFVIPTRVHERYLFPFFAVGAILAAVSWRWRVAFAVVALANFLNLYGVLTTPYYQNPRISDWLGIGDFVRSRLGVTSAALLHTAGFVWAALQLRGGAARALSAELADTARQELAAGSRDRRTPQASRPPDSARPAFLPAGASPAGPATTAGASDALPSMDTEPGLLAPLTRRFGVRPSRADRSRALTGEPGGRLDRLDLWILVVLTIAALGLRTWRLAEPYSMHFDEVYHARTATEFLQDWRYGEPHSIYEYTHPHLAKYAMAAGIVAWGDDRVTGTSDLGVPIRDAAIEARWDDPTVPDHRAGDRLYVATGTEIRAYDLQSRELLAALPLSGATTLAIDPDGHRLFASLADGKVFELDTAAFDALRTGGDARFIEPPVAFGSFEAPVRRLFSTSDGAFLLAITDADEVMSMDAAGGQVLGSVTLQGASDIAPAGSAEGLVANADNLTDPRAEAMVLADILGGDQQELEQRLTSGQGRIVISGTVDPATRPMIESAIADGRLAGFGFESLPSIAVADTQGVQFLSPADMTLTEQVPIAGGATGLALTSGLDAPRLYVAAGRAVTVIKLAAGDESGTAPAVETSIPMPGPVSRVTFDAASVLVHVLGTAPATGNEESASTIYVIEPHAQAVFADARLPFTPTAWTTDVDPQLPSGDREAILAFDMGGSAVSVDVGQHAFSWRMPGVIAGALTAGLLYLLARILFRRRSIGVLVAVFSLADGMLFVQSRIGMNDAYVGLFLLAGYVLFAGLWTGLWQRRWAFWVAMPAIGLLMGLALASKWVAAFAIAAMAVLVLARSALGRILLILGLMVVTVVLGYEGLTYAAPAAGQVATGSGNVLFIVVMIALTLIATVVTVFHPIAWSLEEVRFAVAAPAALGVTIGLLAIPLAGRQARVALGPLAASPSTVAVTVAVGLLLLAGGVAAAFSVAGRFGIGPLAPPLAPDDPAQLADPPAPAPTGWLRPGWAFGLPVIWTAGSLVLLPVIVYVISYIPWALNSGGPAGSPQIFPAGTPIVGNWPPGHTGQTLLDLTKSMYDYHNNLRATHAASSPWWAWPFDLKPVWFYQGSFSGGTAAAIYDAGNLVIWWLGVPAMAFTAWQAFKRRSLALGLVTIAFAFQWLSWSRIDRATFQYHYYTSVPFIILALSYFLAELWHGASRRTWLLARVSATVAIMGPGLLWLFKTPLCAFVGVERAYKDSPACVGNPGDFVLTSQVGLVLLIGVLAAVAFAYEFGHPDDRSVFVAWFGRGSTLGEIGRRVRFPLTVLVLVAGMLAQLAVPSDQVLVSVRAFATTPLAVVAVVILGFLGSFALTARDARRFVLGTVFAAVATFIVVYPNIAALPLPSTVFNAYQGLLPTYLYPFQFPVNTDPPPPASPLFAPVPALLFVGLAVACLVVAYSAWSWRIVLAERRLGVAEDDALARTG